MRVRASAYFSLEHPPPQTQRTACLAGSKMSRTIQTMTARGRLACAGVACVVLALLPSPVRSETIEVKYYGRLEITPAPKY
jgi:hypothetical protein